MGNLNQDAFVTKLENNWRYKTLENLEKDYWGDPPYDSYLVRRTHQIRKLPLIQLTNDDIAMMLMQQFSLDFIVPLAIDRLSEDILAHGDSGIEGAIMEAALRIDSDFWKVHSDYWCTIKGLIDESASVRTFKREQFDQADPKGRSKGSP